MTFRAVLLAAALVALVAGESSSVAASTARGTPAADVQVPLAFVANAGQADREIAFYANGPQVRFAFMPGRAALTYLNRERGFTLGLRFVDARASAAPTGRRRAAGSVNYVLGNDPAAWRANLPAFHEVAYHDLWPGVDVIFSGTGQRLKYDLVVRPGARPQTVRFAYVGTRGVSIDPDGNLRITTPLGVLIDERPSAYQVIGGKRVSVATRYVLHGRDTVGLDVASYAEDRPLFIDPLVYSTFLGGSSVDQGRGVAVDATGSAAVTGLTLSANFPTTPGAFDTTVAAQDAFVTKLDPTGSNAVYSTYLGGSGNDAGFAVTVDAGGNAVVTGNTSSTNFPTILAFDPTFGGVLDAFVTKFSASGLPVFSTYLGGNGEDQGFGIALDAAANPTVVGATASSTGFPVTPLAFDATFNGNLDAFVTKLSSTGALVASTYLGSTLVDSAEGVRLDPGANPVVTGRTTSPLFPTFAAVDFTYNGAQDAFVTKLNSTESALLFSTFLGGGNQDAGHAIALDASANPIVTGDTLSTDFPTFAAYDATHNGGLDAFVTKFAATGAPFLFSTFLGGASSDQGFGVVVDSMGNPVVAGSTSSAGFPVTPGSYDTSYNGAGDAFVTKFAPTGTTLLYSTFLGGSSVDIGAAIDADVSAAVYVVGSTFSANFPITPGAYDTTQASFEGFISKLVTVGAPTTLVLTPPTAQNTVGETHCVKARVTDFAGQPVSDVTVRFSVPTAIATHATPASGSATTNANGEAEFCYTAALPGADVIEAFADSDNNGSRDPGEPMGTATKVWLLPPSTEFCEVKITQGGWITAVNGDRASFGGNANVADGAVKGQEQYQDHGPAQPRNVHSLELTAMTCTDDLTSGTIFGTAAVDGAGEYVFRIDVTDGDNGAAADSYGLIMSDGYASGQKPLEGGNVNIHKN